MRAELVGRRLDQLDPLDAEIRQLKRRIAKLVEATGTSLVQVHGVGPLVAARILGEVGDVRRLGTGTSSPTPTARPRSRPPRAVSSGIG